MDAAGHQQPSPVGAHVLVVEDEPLLLDMIVEALDDEGLKVRSASNFDEALAAADTEAETLKVLLTDIRLADSRSGFDVAVEVRARLPMIFVLYVTGDSEAYVRTKRVDGGMIVPKPYLPSRLAAQIAEMVKVTGTY